MREVLKRLVRLRAEGRCEYCKMPEAFSMIDFEYDHIIARSHGGPTIGENLAFACAQCNAHKGPNLSTFNHETGRIIRLFDPRKKRWAAHFDWDGPVLIGKTPTGRGTIALLKMNDLATVLARRELMEEGHMP